MWEVKDLMYTEEEGNIVFQGTYDECNDYVSEQSEHSFLDSITLKVQQVINNY